MLVEAGQISPEVTVHQVSVPMPLNDLAPPFTTEQQQETDGVKVAIVQEVTKDHIHTVDGHPSITVEQEIPVTVLPTEEDINQTTFQPSITDVEPEKRQSRAVPFMDKEAQPITPQLATDVNVIRNILNQRKQANKPKTMPSAQRSMRSVVVENPPVAQQPASGPVATKITTAATMDPCDLLCTKFEFDPVCATNGVCMHDFPNQCILETFNCRHPTQKFTATKNDRCQMPGVVKCNENDMI